MPPSSSYGPPEGFLGVAAAVDRIVELREPGLIERVERDWLETPEEQRPTLRTPPTPLATLERRAALYEHPSSIRRRTYDEPRRERRLRLESARKGAQHELWQAFVEGAVAVLIELNGGTTQVPAEVLAANGKGRLFGGEPIYWQESSAPVWRRRHPFIAEAVVAKAVVGNLLRVPASADEGNGRLSGPGSMPDASESPEGAGASGRSPAEEPASPMAATPTIRPPEPSPDLVATVQAGAAGPSSCASPTPTTRPTPKARSPRCRLADALRSLRDDGIDIQNHHRGNLQKLALEKARIAAEKHGSSERTFQRALADVLQEG